MYRNCCLSAGSSRPAAPALGRTVNGMALATPRASSFGWDCSSPAGLLICRRNWHFLSYFFPLPHQHGAFRTRLRDGVPPPAFLWVLARTFWQVRASGVMIGAGSGIMTGAGEPVGNPSALARNVGSDLGSGLAAVCSRWAATSACSRWAATSACPRASPTPRTDPPAVPGRRAGHSRFPSPALGS